MLTIEIVVVKIERQRVFKTIEQNVLIRFCEELSAVYAASEIYPNKKIVWAATMAALPVDGFSSRVIVTLVLAHLWNYMTSSPAFLNRRTCSKSLDGQLSFDNGLFKVAMLGTRGPKWLSCCHFRMTPGKVGRCFPKALPPDCFLSTACSERTDFEFGQQSFWSLLGTLETLVTKNLIVLGLYYLFFGFSMSVCLCHRFLLYCCSILLEAST